MILYDRSIYIYYRVYIEYITIYYHILYMYIYI